MASYSAAGTQATTAGTYKSIVTLTAQTSGLRRFRIYDVLVGTAGTPADNYMQFDISRVTTAGTATALVPATLDPADTAASTVCGINTTVEPTVTTATSCFNVGINQRASYRWVAAPGSELVAPATNTNGFALRVLSGGYTGVSTGDILFSE